MTTSDQQTSGRTPEALKVMVAYAKDHASEMTTQEILAVAISLQQVNGFLLDALEAKVMGVPATVNQS